MYRSTTPAASAANAARARVMREAHANAKKCYAAGGTNKNPTYNQILSHCLRSAWITFRSDSATRKRQLEKPVAQENLVLQPDFSLPAAYATEIAQRGWNGIIYHDNAIYSRNEKIMLDKQDLAALCLLHKMRSGSPYAQSASSFTLFRVPGADWGWDIPARVAPGAPYKRRMVVAKHNGQSTIWSELLLRQLNRVPSVSAIHIGLSPTAVAPREQLIPFTQDDFDCFARFLHGSCRKLY